MNKTTGILIIILLLLSSALLAQNKFTKAADNAYSDQQYMIALQRYQKAYSKVKKNKGERDRISFRIAECYRMMNNMKKAEIAYKRLATGNYLKTDPKILLYYADALKTNGNYDEAIAQYKAYLEKYPNDVRSEKGIQSCLDAKDWIKNPSKYTVKWEKKINTKDDEFAPAYADKTHSSIMFTSDRGGAKGKDLDSWTGLSFSDLFIARKDRKGDWSAPILADPNSVVNTKANEGVAKFNSRYTALYFTRCFNEPKKKNGCGVYKASRTGVSTWGDPERIELGGDSTTVFGHPSVSDDESVIIFSADLPGGYGGKDLWMASKKGKTKSGGYAHPVNLGPEINTPGMSFFHLSDKTASCISLPTGKWEWVAWIFSALSDKVRSGANRKT